MSPLLKVLSAALERPRDVTPQVIKHIEGTHGVTREKIGAFLIETLPTLEDYEVELVLAPLFTPTLDDQAQVAAVLGSESVAATQWPELIRQLVVRPTRAQLRMEDGATQAIELREVITERFVNRLRLDGSIAAELRPLIEPIADARERNLLRAIARRAIWREPACREILIHFLKTTTEAERSGDAVALLKLMETYEPANATELLRLIPHWQQVLRQEINDHGHKPFFNERVEELHGGGRDQRRQDDSRISARESEFQFLNRLQNILSLQNK